MELDINLGINSKGQLACLDNTSIDVEDHVSLEYLIPTGAISSVTEGEISVCPNIYTPGVYLRTSVIELPEDGTLTYVKLGIPTWDHLSGDIDKDAIFCNLLAGDEMDTFYIARKAFKKVETDISKYSEIEEIKIKDILQMYFIASRVPGSNTQTYYYEKKIFSIWNLQQCLVNLQRELLEKTPCSCNECGTEKDTIYRRDFLLASLYVFDYLKDIGNFEKAQELLDRLNRSCDWLCGEMNKSNDCGCGKSFR